MKSIHKHREWGVLVACLLITALIFWTAWNLPDPDLESSATKDFRISQETQALNNQIGTLMHEVRYLRQDRDLGLSANKLWEEYGGKMGKLLAQKDAQIRRLQNTSTDWSTAAPYSAPLTVGISSGIYSNSYTSLLLSDNGRVTVTIHPDGTVEYPGSVWEESATFWRAMQETFPSLCKKPDGAQ